MTSPEPSSLPADPVAYRRKGLSVWFWLVVIFGVACVVLGAVLATFTPDLFPRGKTTQPATLSTAPQPALGAEPVAAPVAVVAAPEAPPAQGDVTGLAARVQQLETAQGETLAAASAALASASLIQAAQTSRPFAGELAAVQPLLPPSADLAQLQRLAQIGAPTRSALAAEFPAFASQAIAASRAPGDKAGLFERARHAVGAIVTIRRVDYTQGTGAHAILARAEALLADGDVEGALAELDGLSPAARDALGAWRARAERRAEIDRRLGSVTSSALQVLKSAGKPAA